MPSHLTSKKRNFPTSVKSGFEYAAAPRGAVSTQDKGAGGQPPPGYAWLTDFEGNALYDFENNRMYGAV